MKTATTTKARLKRVVLALCAAVCLFAPAPLSPSRLAARADAPAAEYAATPEGRLRVFDEVWEQVRLRYFDPEMHGVDWQEMKRELRPQAADARGEAELYPPLRRTLG